jgi:DNA-binding CsgD family transcriptional regulator
MRDLVERDGELARVGRVFDRVLTGSGAVIVVEGAAGIGKSELLAAAGAAGKARGLKVLRARGSEFEAEIAFGVARQLFEPMLRGASGAERRRLLDGVARVGGRALGVEEGDPPADRFVVFRRAPSSSARWISPTGAAPRRIANQARAELIAAGARPRRDAITGRDALTAGELRVARLAAEGLTNREIAQALFITTKTAKAHLNRVYRKLEITRRGQLAGALGGVGDYRRERPSASMTAIS